MKNSTFNVGDLVFEIALNRKIRVVRLMSNDSEAYPLKSDEDSYDTNGFIFTHDAGGMPGIFHATPENRQALIVLCGENEVPEIPSYGSDLTRKLLKTQKYVLCKISRYSDERARTFKDVRTVYSTFNGGFMCEDGDIVEYAVPIDMNGNEIMEINYNDKKLTHAVFDLPECPDWAVSAAVDEDGRAYYHSKKKESLTVIPSDGDYLGLHVANVSPPDYDYYDRLELIGSGHDTTNWQQSAIDRE